MNATAVVTTVAAVLAGIGVGALAFGPKSAYAKGQQGPSGPAGKWQRLTPSPDGYYSVPPGATFAVAYPVPQGLPVRNSPNALALATTLANAVAAGAVVDFVDMSSTTKPPPPWPSDDDAFVAFRAEAVVSPSEAAPLEFTQAGSPQVPAYFMWQWVPA